MMRKLAVTVFAMSLTLIGCGSSSSSKKDGAAPDARVTTDGGNKDVITVSPDTQIADVLVTDTKAADTSVATDANKADGQVDADVRDGSLVDGVVLPVDTNKADTTVKVTDAPVDSATVSPDASLEVGGDAAGDADAT
jgi:hypothetical protein